MVENCGMPEEHIYHGVEEIPDDAGYYSLIIAKEHTIETKNLTKTFEIILLLWILWISKLRPENSSGFWDRMVPERRPPSDCSLTLLLPTLGRNLDRRTAADPSEPTGSQA